MKIFKGRKTKEVETPQETTEESKKEETEMKKETGKKDLKKVIVGLLAGAAALGGIGLAVIKSRKGLSDDEFDDAVAVDTDSSDAADFSEV